MATMTRAAMGEAVSAVGAESGHPNPSGGVQEGFLDEDVCVETHEISDGLARGKDGG